MYDSCRAGLFSADFGTHKYLGTHDSKKVANPSKITLHCNCHRTAPRRATKVSNFKGKGHSIFSYKMHFLQKCLVVALDEVEVET